VVSANADWWNEIVHAVRSLRRTPGFTLAAVLTLALGIGANAAIFSVADATAFRPPDVPRPAELMRAFSTTRDTPFGELSYPDYLDFRTRTTTLSGLAAYETLDFSFAADRRDPAQYVGGWAVSANFFTVLEARMALGRAFSADDERVAAPVAVISHRLWERTFSRQPDVVGTNIVLSGASFTVIGVSPDPFGTELYFHPDVFIPLSALRLAYPSLPANVLEERQRTWLTSVGRLRSSASAAQAATEFANLARDLERAYPESNRGRRATVLAEMTARAQLDSGGAQGAIFFVAIVSLVLVLACANVANLLLSRGASRRRELALRVAIGASRWRLIRQLLLESVVLSSAGTVAGLLLASAMVSYLSTLFVIPSALPLSIDLRIDTRVLVVAALAGILTTAFCGLAPAWSILRLAFAQNLKTTRTESFGKVRMSLRTSLVVLQVALAVIVLVASGVLVQTFRVAQRVDPGFKSDHVLLASFNPGLVRYDAAGARRFYEALLDRVRSAPGVTAAGLTRYVPLGVLNGSLAVSMEGAPADDHRRVMVAETSVDPGYWNVARTPIVRGRAFDTSDTASSPPIAIVNETFARRFWPHQEPIGKTVTFPDLPSPTGARAVTAQIVGVARDGKYWQLGEAPQPFIYRPLSQGRRLALTLMILTQREPSDLSSAVRAAAAAVDPAVPVFDVRTLDDLYQSRALLPSRMMSRLVTALGVSALLLSAIGLYAVIAFLAARRTYEIGIRMALGAAPGGVVGLVMRQAAILVLPGIALGMGAAFLLAPLLARREFDFVTPRDPRVFGLVTLMTSCVTLLAAGIPARRAARVDPTIALRAE
jgi:putative ABC transport system permease protein